MIPNYNVLRETYLALLNEACFVEMLEMCERVYFEADTDGDDATAAVALLGMSNACLAGGESYKSETYARRALYFAEQSRDDRVMCDALVDLGGLEVMVNGQHDTAREHLNRALTLARLIEYHEGQAGALRGIGVSYLQQGQMQLALSYLNQATAIAYQTPNKRLQALTSNSLGYWYLESNQPVKAADYYKRAIDHCQQSGDRINEATTLCNLGMTYIQQHTPNAYHIAFEYFERSLNIARDLRYPYAEISALDALGLTYTNLQQHHRAIEYFREAYALAKLNENDALLIVALEHLIETYHTLQSCERAVKACKELIQLQHRAGNYTQVMEKTLKLALIYREAGDFDQTFSYYKEALEICRTYNLKDQAFTAPLNMLAWTFSDLPRILPFWLNGKK
jgi:tetratricopeptide (TPR) repeat protein